MNLTPGGIEVAVDIGFSDIPFRCEITALPEHECRPINLGLADLQLVEVSRLGHRDKFPRPYDWENLLSLINPGEELLWIISKDPDRFRFYLGLKANSVVIPDRETVRQRRRNFAAIANHFCRRTFPESCVEELRAPTVAQIFGGIADAAKKRMVSVSGVPSPKDLEKDVIFEERHEDRRPQASLNDILEPLLNEDFFCLVFSLGAAERYEVVEKLRILTDLRDAIHPFKQTEGSVNKGFNIGGHEDVAHALSKSIGQQEQRWLLPKIAQFLVGTKAGAAKGEEEKDGRMQKFGGWNAGTNYQISDSNTNTRGTNWGIQAGETVNFSRINSALELIDQSVDLSIRHIEQGLGTGAFFGHVAVYATNPFSAARIGQMLAGALSGSHSHARPFQVIPCSEREADFSLRTTAAMHRVLRGVAILNSQQAGRLLITPEAELPGLKLKRNVFYGRAPAQDDAGPENDRETSTVVKLGDSAFFKGGFTTAPNRKIAGDTWAEKRKFTIPARDLMSHMLITGTTGSGKTVRATSVLNNLTPQKQFRILAIETAKKTYRAKLHRSEQAPLVYTLGNSNENAFRINPFYFDPGTSLKRHISVLSDALCELLPVEALIGPKLHEAIVNAYFETGWNVEYGTFDRNGPPVYPTMIDLNAQVIALCEQLKYSPELNQNYTGALSGRARIFIDDVYQDIFAFNGNKAFDDLFPRDTILEMDELPPSEVNMPAFIVSLLLERLRAFRSAHPELDYQHIVVIEEAHNILHRKHEAEHRADEAGGGKRLLDQVVRLLQEGRELGIGVIVVDQSAESLADAVLKNTNTKIVHRLEDGEETRTVGTAIGLDEEDWPDLQKLEDGECIVKTKQTLRPVKLAPLSEQELRPTGGLPKTKKAPFIPDYTAAQRLIERIHRQAMTATEVTALGNELFEKVCRCNLELANFMVGKYRTWRSLIHTAMPWVIARDKQEFLKILGCLASEHLSAASEFDSMLLRDLAGSEFDQDGLALSRAVFGQRWLSKAAALFITEFGLACAGLLPSHELMSISEHALTLLTHRLEAWAQSIETGDRRTEASALVKLAVFRYPTIQSILFPVLIARFWKYRPVPDEAFREIRAFASIRDWDEVSRLLRERVPSVRDSRIQSGLLVYAFALAQAALGTPESGSVQIRDFAESLPEITRELQ